MFKYIRAALFVIVYIVVYLLNMLLSQIILGLTIGRGGAQLMELLRRETPVGQAELQSAIDATATNIVNYTAKNTGIILSISALMSLLIFIYIFRARKVDLFAVIKMNKKPVGTDVRYGAFAGASANFVFSLIFLLVQNFGFFKDAFENYDLHMNQTFGAGGIFQLMLGVGIVGPMVEEIMFRGLIPFELGRVAPQKVILFAQGALFGIMHLEPVQIVYTIPLGVYLGYISYKSDSVWPAAAAHIAMNSISVLLTAPSVEDAILRTPEIGLLIMGASLFMFISSIIYFIKKKPTQTASN